MGDVGEEDELDEVYDDEPEYDVEKVVESEDIELFFRVYGDGGVGWYEGGGYDEVEVGVEW